MYKLISRLVIYREADKEGILSDLAEICRAVDAGDFDREELAGKTLAVVNRLLDVATRYGFDGNLWQAYLAFGLAVTEAPFTLVCEKRGASSGSVRRFAENDLTIFRKLWDYDFSGLEKVLGLNCFSILTDYQAVAKSRRWPSRSRFTIRASATRCVSLRPLSAALQMGRRSLPW